MSWSMDCTNCSKRFKDNTNSSICPECRRKIQEQKNKRQTTGQHVYRGPPIYQQHVSSPYAGGGSYQQVPSPYAGGGGGYQHVPSPYAGGGGGYQHVPSPYASGGGGGYQYVHPGVAPLQPPVNIYNIINNGNNTSTGNTNNQPTCDENVVRWLKEKCKFSESDLSRCCTIFAKNGYYSLDTIRLMPRENLSKMEFPLGHIDLLSAAIVQLQSSETLKSLPQNDDLKIVTEKMATMVFDNPTNDMSSGYQKRFIFDEVSDYKGVIATVRYFTPTKTCREYVQDLSKEDGCHKFDFILNECENWVSFKMQGSSFNPDKLDKNEVLALAIYAWDLGVNGEQQENFYYVLNNMLRKRISTTVKKWAGYLYYMQKALSKLPNLKGTVYRGISVNNYKLIQDNYTSGRRIHWSAFSSTSTDLKKARDFATNKGIVMTIQIHNGKSIEPYSPIQEAEILLSPNMAFVVAQEIHSHDGYARIVLVQESPDETFVF